MVNQDACVNGAESTEDTMSAGDLESLVRAAVFEAVRGGAEPMSDPQPDAILLVGQRAGDAVRRAVVATIKEIVGESAITSGPLREATRRLAEVSEATEKLWRGLRDLEDEIGGKTAVEEVKVEEAKKTKVAGPVVSTQKRCAGCKIGLSETNRSQRNAVYCSSCLAGKSDPQVDPVASENPVSVTPADAATAATPTRRNRKRDQASVKTTFEPLWVNGIKVTFNERTQPAFVAFFPEFIEAIQKGPVSGRWAFERAQELGFLASRSTFSRNIDNRLEIIRKPDPVTEESMWSLPKKTEAP